MKFELNQEQLHNLRLLKDNYFLNKSELKKSIIKIFDEESTVKILDLIIEINHNINGRPSNQNYPLY